MKKVKYKTTEKLFSNLHKVHEATDKSLVNMQITEKFNVDLLKDTRRHMETLEKIVCTAEFIEDGTLKETLTAYIEIKTDTINEIIALELLLYDKKKKYQQLLIKSNREYEKLSSSTDNIKLRNELKKELADEIFNFKNYLNELINVADRKRHILTKKLNKHQKQNRDLVEYLEKNTHKGILPNVAQDKYALVQ